MKSVNAKGGVNGHDVKLIVYDDGGDSARHRAQVQDAIENQHVIAFLANTETLTGQQSVEYITKKRIPIIGTDGGNGWAYDSPMYFSQQPAAEPQLFSWAAAAANQVVPRGKDKLGTIVCTEVQTCTTLDRVYAKYAKSLGLEHVYSSKASLAQPDFTAECLAARNAGVEVITVGLDSNSVTRLATSCARQGYRPIFNTFTAIILDRFKDDPNLDGLVTGFNLFPWFQSGTPATDEYQRAVQKYGQGLIPGEGIPTGWAAGKLFEKAAALMAEPPTTAALLKGLWSIKGDNLGGLTGPLTFVENEPMPKSACWINVTLKDKAWTSPDGFEMHCRGWPPSAS